MSRVKQAVEVVAFVAVFLALIILPLVAVASLMVYTVFACWREIL